MKMALCAALTLATATLSGGVPEKPLVDLVLKFDAPGPATRIPVTGPLSNRQFELSVQALAGYGAIGHVELSLRRTDPKTERDPGDSHDKNLLAEDHAWYGMERYMIWPQQLAADPEPGSEFGRVRIFLVDDLEIRVEILRWDYNRPARATDWRTDLGFQNITLRVVIVRSPAGRHLS